MTAPINPAMLASVDDYVNTPGVPDPPVNITAILTRCSEMVLDATETAVYAVDDQGNATDSGTLAALKGATIAQAAAWVTLRIDPNAGGVVQTGAKSSKRLATASIEYADAGAAAQARADAYTGLVDAAVRKLRLANLLSQPAWML